MALDFAQSRVSSGPKAAKNEHTLGTFINYLGQRKGGGPKSTEPTIKLTFMGWGRGKKVRFMTYVVNGYKSIRQISQFDRVRTGTE